MRLCQGMQIRCTQVCCEINAQLREQLLHQLRVLIRELLERRITQPHRFDGGFCHYGGRARLPVDESNLTHRCPRTHAGHTQVRAVVGRQLHAGLPSCDEPQRITGFALTNKTVARFERVQGHHASQSAALVVSQVRRPQQVAQVIFCLKRRQVFLQKQ